MSAKRDSKTFNDPSDKAYDKNNFESCFQNPSDDEELMIFSYSCLSFSFSIFIGATDFFSFSIYSYSICISCISIDYNFSSSCISSSQS